VRLKVTKAGFIIGVGGGSGVLHFKGKNYRLSVSGMSIGSSGIRDEQRQTQLPEFGRPALRR
jgi:hypothetical protein